MKQLAAYNNVSQLLDRTSVRSICSNQSALEITQRFEPRIIHAYAGDLDWHLLEVRMIDAIATSRYPQIRFLMYMIE